MDPERWRRLAEQQCGLLTRTQLRECGVERWSITHRLRSGRWLELTRTVICTTTGILAREQLMWLGVLHAGPGSMIGDLTAAELHHLRNWSREEITVLVPYRSAVPVPYPGLVFRRSRRDLVAIQRSLGGLPVSRLEPAVLLWASRERSPRSAEGVLAAVVQQGLSSPDRLGEWLDRLAPVRGAARLRRSLAEIATGAHSVAEIDVRRMCRSFGLAQPQRQVRRRDSSGRLRYTDCEWPLADGRTLVLEVDGSFHMEIQHWEEDIARQRGLSSATRLVVRCTARELRDEPFRVAHDLRLLGVPAA